MALDHDFFTLTVGAGCMLAYGSYLSRHTRFYGPLITVVFLDVLVAILAGLAIFSIVFSRGLTAIGGPVKASILVGFFCLGIRYRFRSLI